MIWWVKPNHFKETPMISMQFFENCLWALLRLRGLMCPWNSDILSLQNVTTSLKPTANAPWKIVLAETPKGSRIVANQALIFRGGTCPFQRGYLYSSDEIGWDSLKLITIRFYRMDSVDIWWRSHVSSIGSRGRISQLRLFCCLELLMKKLHVFGEKWLYKFWRFFWLEVICWQQFGFHPPNNFPKVVIRGHICCVLLCFLFQSPPDRIGRFGVPIPSSLTGILGEILVQGYS